MRRTAITAGATMLGLALLIGLAPGASNLAGSSARTASLTQVARAHALFAKYMSAHAPVIRAGAAKLDAGSVSSQPSANWSGFADVESSSSTNTVSAVVGHWTMPAVTCPTAPYQNSDAFLANWVGLDGWTDQTVEQLGTGAQCYEGVTYYYVWYEMYPNATVQEGTSACINYNVDCPQPGDQISASVTVTKGSAGENNYHLSLLDATTPGNSFTVFQQCAAATCLDTSAEWIIERPAVLPPFGVQILPLADYGTTRFLQGLVISGGRPSTIAGFNGDVYDIPMVDDTAGYYLDCVGQKAPTASLLLSSDATACPTVSPFADNFSATWDAGF